MKKLLLLLSSTALLSACGSTSSLNPSDLNRPIASQEARLVLTRSNSLLYFGGSAKVEANGNEIARLGVGGSAVRDIKAGETVLKVSTPTAFGQFVVRFDAKPSETYRFKISPKTDALVLGSAFGMIGDAVNAQISDTSGYFQLEMLP